MKKNLVMLSALGLVWGLALPALAANTPQDVPHNHWSYEAVSYLAHAGIIEGYTDGDFNGSKNMSRYEMAQIVYKALQNEAKANIAQKALIDKLAGEYALDMNKLNSMDERLTKVEKAQAVKFSGRLLEQYKSKSFANDNKTGWSRNQWQVRLQADAAVDKNTTATIRIANPTPTSGSFKDGTAKFAGDNSDNSFKVDRFYATSTLGHATKLTLGRQAMDIDPEDLIVDGGFFSYDGAKLVWDWQGINFDVKYGKFARNVTGYTFGSGITGNNHDFDNLDILAARIGSKVGRLNWDIGLANFRNNDLKVTPMNYYFANLGYQFSDKFSMSGEIGKNTKADWGGSYWMLSGVYGAQKLNAPHKQNFTVTYLHAGENSLNGVYTSFDQPTEDDNNGINGTAWNNLDLAYRYAFSSKVIGKLEFGNVLDQQNSDENYHFWKAQVIYRF